MVLNRATLTYSAPSAFASQPQFPLLLTAFRQHLPLHNLHWKSQLPPNQAQPAPGGGGTTPSSAAGSSGGNAQGVTGAGGVLRTVQELQVELVPLEQVPEEQASQVPVSLLERPLGNLYFVQCDDVDLYKTTLRKHIRDWVSLVSPRKNQDYLIVLVVRPEQGGAGKGGLLRGMKSTVLDRMKADFMVGKKDHCTQLTWSPSSTDPSGWSDLLPRLKDLLLSSFSSALLLRSQEVDRLEQQRHLPGWNFCTFFVAKETLAMSFEGMGLMEEALGVYDQLEEMFEVVLREDHLTWFGSLGGSSPTDDSLPLLSLSKKPYRDLLLSNTITVFDFRCYLLARQCSLLGQMLKVTRLARKAGGFVSGFARVLERESLDTYPPFFLPSWQYSSALSVVDACQAWARSVTLDAAATVSLNGALAELLELARNQLDWIGLKTGHLPKRDPYLAVERVGHEHHPHLPSNSAALAQEENDISEAPEEEQRKISNPDLLKAIDSREEFDALYVGLTKRAIECCVLSKRKRSALRLHWSLAVLDVVRGRPSPAAAAYRSLPPHYSHSLWASLEAPLLARSLACIDLLPPEEREKEERRSEWVQDCLGLMKAWVGVENGGGQADFEMFLEEGEALAAAAGTSEIPPEEKMQRGLSEYFGDLVRKLKEHAEKLDDDLRVTHHPALTLLLETKAARPAEGQDGSYLDVVIVNALPCEIRADGIQVSLAGVNEGDRALFGAGETAIPTGRSEFKLFCPSPNAGLYVLDSSSILISHVIFYQTPPTNVQPTQGIKLPADYGCTTVLASPPRIMHLDQSPRLMLTIVAGRNNLKRATLSVSDLSGNVSFQLSSAAREEKSESQGELEVTGEELHISSLPKYAEMEIVIPYYGTDRGTGISLLIEGTYVTEEQPEVVRTLRITRLVRVTLPMAVNVQDFFRGPNTFSKFSVASDGQQYLRLLGAKLEGTTDLYDIKTGQILGGPTIVSPTRQASFIFKLVSKETGSPREAGDPLRVVITYRSLWDEMFSVVSGHVKRIAAELGAEEHTEWLREQVIARLEREDDQLERYSATGLLKLKVSDDVWSDAMASYERGRESQALLLQAVSQVVEFINMGPPVIPEKCNMRILSIPVDVPVTQILNSVRIELPKDSNIYAGQAVPAILHIDSARSPEGSTPQKMGFDVLADFATWLVSGQKRGEFIVEGKITVSIPLTLVPMRHGSLFLPQVSVYPIPAEDTPTFDGRPPELPSSDTYQANAAETVLVLNRAARTTYVINLPTLGPVQAMA